MRLNQSYSEKVVYLPNSYHVNDKMCLISDRLFTTRELGLSEDGFVFIILMIILRLFLLPLEAG
jgi:predicted O-linked N-acetylglucosamine transferase (SPINDLY family)